MLHSLLCWNLLSLAKNNGDLTSAIPVTRHSNKEVVLHICLYSKTAQNFHWRLSSKWTSVAHFEYHSHIHSFILGLFEHKSAWNKQKLRLKPQLMRHQIWQMKTEWMQFYSSSMKSQHMWPNFTLPYRRRLKNVAGSKKQPWKSALNSAQRCEFGRSLEYGKNTGPCARFRCLTPKGFWLCFLQKHCKTAISRASTKF